MKLSDDFKMTEINPGVLEWDGNKLVVLGDNRFILCLDESVLESYRTVSDEVQKFFGDSQICTFVVRKGSAYTPFSEMGAPHFEAVFGELIRNFIWKELESVELNPFSVHSFDLSDPHHAFRITKGK